MLRICAILAIAITAVISVTVVLGILKRRREVYSDF